VIFTMITCVRKKREGENGKENAMREPDVCVELSDELITPRINRKKLQRMDCIF